jgi:hypothetical protein
LLAGGIDPQGAAWACDIFVLLVMATAREDDVRRPRGGPGGDGLGREQVNELYETFVGLRPDSFPLLAANAAQMVAGDGDERFRFVIDVVIDGVVARAARR